jgi:hypothetical protein
MTPTTDHAAPRSTVARRLTVALGGVALTVGAAVLSLLLLFFAGWKCDESCDPGSGRWQDDPTAWQWDGFAVLAVAGFVPVVGAVVLWARRRDRSAAISLGVAALVYAAAFVLVP